jgi:hypothetical protein
MFLRHLNNALLLVLLAASLACGDQITTSAAVPPNSAQNSRGSDPHGAIPLRDDESPASWVRRSTQQLWEHIASTDSVVVVGLKAPGAARGVWRGDVLIGSAQQAEGRAAALAHRDVVLLAAGPTLPILKLKVGSPEALAYLRRLPFVDYMEPATLKLVTNAPFRASGCSASGGGQTWGGGTTPANYEYQGQQYADVLPANYTAMGIVAAWRYSQGVGVTVGSIDTGVDHTQRELNELFSSGAISSRTRVYDATYPTTNNPRWTDGCGHGTHQAGVIAAPLNGVNMVGVAWGANLVAIRHDGDTMNTWHVVDTYDAIHRAVDHGARIISMAFGAQNTWSNLIADAIRYHTARNVLFVGAAGSSPGMAAADGCANPYGTIFPAEMDEVIAATGVNANGNLVCGVWYGPKVDIAAVVEQVATGAPRIGDGDLAGSGLSSNATAIVAGTGSHRDTEAQRRTYLCASVSLCECGAPTGKP